MRATVRITWLLLCLSILFHGVHLSTQPDVSGGLSAGAETTIKSMADTTTVGTTGAPTTDDPSKKDKPTTPKPDTPVTMPATTVAVTPKPTDKPASTQPPITKNPPTTIFGATDTVVNIATVAASTLSPLKTTAPAATVDSRSSSVVTSNDATTQTQKATEPSSTSVSGLSDRSGNSNLGTTKITKVSTGAPTTEKQSMTHTTITSKTSQEASKGAEGTEITTVTVTSHKPTTVRATETAGTTGTASTTSTLPKSRPPATKTLVTTAGTTSSESTTTAVTAAQSKTFSYSLNNGHEKEERKDLMEVCRRLMANLHEGNCILTWQEHDGKKQFDYVEISGKVKTSLASQYYEEITKKPTDNKTLIAILAACGALLIMIVILAVCASHHRRPLNENQQHLTEELHTVENGYHDNPTLEVMEVQPEMQEKKTALFSNDSWIVPIDNLLKDEIPDEEDTHL